MCFKIQNFEIPLSRDSDKKYKRMLSVENRNVHSIPGNSTGWLAIRWIVIIILLHTLLSFLTAHHLLPTKMDKNWHRQI